MYDRFIVIVFLLLESVAWTFVLNSYHFQTHLSRQYQNKLEMRLSTPGPADLLLAEGSGSPCRIKVIGVGGGGGNAVNRMMESSLGVAGVEFWVVNTDAQALARSVVPRKLNIGTTTSRYLIF